MTRVIEKKDWRDNLESCWAAQSQLHSCVKNSGNFKNLSQEDQEVLLDGTDKNLISFYLKSWYSNKESFTKNNLLVHNTDSRFWRQNHDNLKSIHDQCNLFSFYECLENKFNLINLNGHFKSKL